MLWFFGKNAADHAKNFKFYFNPPLNPISAENKKYIEFLNI
jgi:hypothetical protein